MSENKRILNKDDFESILGYYDIFKKLVDQNGVCSGIHCKNCPFNIDNVIIGTCINVDILETSKNLLNINKK